MQQGAGAIDRRVDKEGPKARPGDEEVAGEHGLLGGESNIQGLGDELPRSMTGFHVRRTIARDLAKKGQRLSEKTSSFFQTIK